MLEVLEEADKGLTSRQIYERLRAKGISIGKGTMIVNLGNLANRSNPVVIRYYPNGLLKPCYILKSKATKKHYKTYNNVPEWMWPKWVTRDKVLA